MNGTIANLRNPITFLLSISVLIRGTTLTTRRYRPREPDSTAAESCRSGGQGQGRQDWNDYGGGDIRFCPPPWVVAPRRGRLARDPVQISETVQDPVMYLVRHSRSANCGSGST